MIGLVRIPSYQEAAQPFKRVRCGYLGWHRPFRRLAARHEAAVTVAAIGEWL